MISKKYPEHIERVIEEFKRGNYYSAGEGNYFCSICRERKGEFIFFEFQDGFSTKREFYNASCLENLCNTENFKKFLAEKQETMEKLKIRLQITHN